MVQTKNIFWTEQDSLPVRFLSGKTLQDTKFYKVDDMIESEEQIDDNLGNNPQNFASESQKSTRKSLINYSVCEHKFCLGLPEGCHEDRSCDVLLSGNFLAVHNIIVIKIYLKI